MGKGITFTFSEVIPYLFILCHKFQKTPNIKANILKKKFRCAAHALLPVRIKGPGVSWYLAERYELRASSCELRASPLRLNA